MRSEFEKWLGDVWLSDAKWDESKNTYSDSRIHCMWSAWQHQQTKIDELQKRVDAALKLIESWNKTEFDKTTHWTEGYEQGCYHCAAQLEQALKGGSDASN